MTAANGERFELAVPLGDFSVAALEAASGEICSLESVTRHALYYYLADRDSHRPGWPYPSFRRVADAAGPPEVVLSLRVERAAWERFAAEAADQQVGPEQLLRHAVLYFAADVDAGRVARQLLDELAEPGARG